MNVMELQLISFLLLLSYSSESLSDKECNRIKFESKWYNKEVLWSHVGRAFNLNVHRRSNTLFFSFSVLDTYSDVNFQLAYYNIDTRDYSVIAGIADGCAVAIDQKNDEIYLGGSDGIYKFNMVTTIADFYKQKGKNIWSLFYKRNLFYINYPDQQLFMRVDDKFAKVKEFEKFQIDYFYVSNVNEIIFSNKTGLYKYNAATGIANIINESITVRQISEDTYGDVYICSNVGLYIYQNGILIKILDMKNLHGVAFDRDNTLVMSTQKSVFRLVPSNTSCIKDTEEEIW
ncbi:ommochrome-binding protein-like [Pieris rapae]|uniref:ommochrome-binding protein-like n=1 Tax=Pieris rapae TaxID=64459 RepID=UPI001E27E1EA|nr:ommochrome-binding protein-like [Pieris rapae]